MKNIYKRLEIFVWWTCNQKCTYCMEYPNMEKFWNKKVSKEEILKKLIKYKKLWYNHVTFLWWEPFIQEVFLSALKIAKKLNYTVLVTTNCTTLNIPKQAEKFLVYIDELILSVEAIEKEKQQLISRTKNFVSWEWVFENIKKYWSWNMLKANIVITKDNLKDLVEIVKFLYKNWITQIAITYPDIAFNYYKKEFILDKIAPRYIDCIDYIYDIIDFSKKNNIRLKIADFPFCVFKKENIDNIIKFTDEYDYQDRLKLDFNKDEFSHLKNLNLHQNLSLNSKLQKLPRDRAHCDKCLECIYKDVCWGPSIHYEKLYSLDEINPIK